MLFFPAIHNSAEWFECRRGIPTSSCFNQIINPETYLKKRKIAQGAKDVHNDIKTKDQLAKELGVTQVTVNSYIKKYNPDSEIPKVELLAGAETYAHMLLAEIIMGESLDKFPPSFWMERGALMEQEAADLYQFETGYTLDRGGFMTDDKMRWGSSPDRRILDDKGDCIGFLEIKCPAPWTHVKNLLKKEIDKTYNPQVQGQMLVGDAKFVDWFSYHPDMPPTLIRTNRDDDYISILSEGLIMFDNMMLRKLKELIEVGAIDEIPQKSMPEFHDSIQDLIDGDFETTLMAG